MDDERELRICLVQSGKVRRKKRKPKKDVVGQGRRWAGWRGLYSPTDRLNGPVIVRKVNP